jgi:hypothetical protein
MASNETYKLAHTARCKLHMAAKEPDRNLRFLLGHAFTLDKLMLRVAEIETSSDSDEEMEDASKTEGEVAEMPRCTRVAPIEPTPRRPSVTFRDNSNRPSGELRQEVEPGNGAMNRGRRSPPPNQFAHLDDTDSDSSNNEYFDDEEDEDGAGLTRFESATAQPPRMVEDEGSDEEEDDGPKSPPQMPTEEELKMITEGEVNEELVDLYEKVAGCPCHGQKGPKSAGKVWEIPQKPGMQGPRMAVIEVTA